MLHDRARIHVQAGRGGDGALSFRREAHVPRGGPDGGDGGHGGAVIALCDASLRDLQAFHRNAHYRAGRGGHGEGAQRHGASGEDLLLRVPPGTEITTAEGELAGVRWELLSEGQRAIVARGGAGGRGNKHFATPTRQAPRFAERGLAGQEGWLELRLRLLADVGLVGLPNAGKSSLLARLTRAAPKVADYPFTTLEPVLGVLEGEERQLVVADIPGLIEGASEGAGLGVDFLAHVERTSVLVHVLDIAPELTGGAEPEANYETIERELAAHDERLAALPRVLALSKSDLVTAEHTQQAIAQWQARVGPETPVIATSSATRAGIETLAAELLHRVPTARAQEDVDEAALRAAGMGRGVEDQGVPLDPELPPAVPHDGAEEEVLAEHMVFRPAPRTGFTVERLAAGRFAVRGRGIERLLARHDTENAEAMAYVEERLRRIGVLGALEAEGYEPGDELEIGGRLLALKLRA